MKSLIPDGKVVMLTCLWPSCNDVLIVLLSKKRFKPSNVFVSTHDKRLPLRVSVLISVPLRRMTKRVASATQSVFGCILSITAALGPNLSRVWKVRGFVPFGRVEMGLQLSNDRALQYFTWSDRVLLFYHDYMINLCQRGSVKEICSILLLDRHSPIHSV